MSISYKDKKYDSGLFILRAIEELTCKNITYKSASGKSYDFNTADKMNCLLVNALLATGQLKSGQEYDFDFDHQFIETEKYDAKPTYKKFLGYSSGVAVINDMIVGIENRDGNKGSRYKAFLWRSSLNEQCRCCHECL